MDNYKVIGVMSGTSLDGVDLAYCQFQKSDKWEFNFECADTVAYSEEWKQKLSTWYLKEKDSLADADHIYGIFLAETIADFIQSNNLEPDFIASHGHTILHQPNKGLTLQIGDGKIIADRLKVPVIYDFRSKDVLLGGQGAPLVPIGDRLLFGDYEYCLNLGGFANISFEYENQRVAFDICPVNIVLNFLSQKMGLPYDADGNIGRVGVVDQNLLNSLNSLEYYQRHFPKSLGREWVEGNILPLLEGKLNDIPGLIATYTHHAAFQIGQVLEQSHEPAKILVTGGGAHNKYLIELIQKNTNKKLVIPDDNIINFKESIIFAFLGVLRWRNEINCLSSVTGASSDSISGEIALP